MSSRPFFASKVTDYVSPLLQHPINKLFVPRVTPEYLPPPDRDESERTWVRVQPTSHYIHLLEEEPINKPNTITETYVRPKLARIQRIQQRKIENRAAIEAKLDEWDPNTIENGTEDPHKTLFVGRLPFDVSEGRLWREFERYGTVKQIKLIRETTTQRPRGYAFVEYERERDLRAAFLDADGLKIDGVRRIVVDIERGRTIKEWRPRRLGGGLGRTRLGGKEVNQKFSGRDPRAIEQMDVTMQQALGLGRTGGGSMTGRKRSPSPPHYEREQYRGSSHRGDSDRRSRDGYHRR